jgi:hypothetical protein
VNTTDSSLFSVSRPGWQLLGETQLLADATADTINTWMVEILGPLNLQPDFVKQLLHSAQDVTMRALHSNTSMGFEHIHLWIFAPSDVNRNGNSWGFFRIEKIDITEPNQDHPAHTVEFYLYLEGQ